MDAGAQRTLYRLPTLIAAVDAGRPVWLVEGEKDVEALEQAGAVATTAGAISGWQPQFVGYFAGAHVTIVADSDGPGRKHARRVAADLEGIAAAVRIVEAAHGKDAADHLNAGHGLEEFKPPTSPEPEGTVAEDTAAADQAVEDQLNEAHQWQIDLDAEIRHQRLRRDAARILAVEDAPAFRMLGVREFLDLPQPERIVDGLFYRDSLARVFGPGGSNKSFLMLDLCLRVALGWPWCGQPVQASSVIFVMAEAPATNSARLAAWCRYHHVDQARLEGRFFAVTEPVMLTEDSVGPLAKAAAEVGAGLMVVDPKHASMVGDEDKAADIAVMRRGLDVIRRACGAAIVLVDHTGYGTEARARGSSAVTAAMDLEVRVEASSTHGEYVTATVTRDKAAEAGARWHLRRVAFGSGAVIIPDSEGGDTPATSTAGGAATDAQPAWLTADLAVPAEVRDYQGAGAALIVDLTRYMIHEASTAYGDPTGYVGTARIDAEKAMRIAGLIGKDNTSVRRAWNALLQLGLIVPAEGVKVPTGRHIWNG